MKRHLLTLAAALLLGACGSPPPPATTTPAPSATPAPQPTATPAPQGEFIPETPPALLRLPAPLYLRELGQIARIERDGKTRKLLTDETIEIAGFPPIADFALSPLGTMAYVVGDRERDRLVVADARGEGARILYAEVGHELSDLLFTPDGESILLRLLNNREPPDIPGGLYRVPVTGGPLELVLADDPVDDPVNPARTVSGYAPFAFSPAGDQLLVEVRSLFYEDCILGVMPAAGGDVLRITVPETEQVYCGEAAWAADGSAILFLAGPKEGNDAGPQLWRADAATAAAAPLLAPGTFARAPTGLPGGVTRFFLATVERDAAGMITGASFAPAELGPQDTEATTIGPAFTDQLFDVLWAPDGTGAVLEVGPPGIKSLLRWLPLGGESGAAEIELPSAEDSVGEMFWGLE